MNQFVINFITGYFTSHIVDFLKGANFTPSDEAKIVIRFICAILSFVMACLVGYADGSLQTLDWSSLLITLGNAAWVFISAEITYHKLLKG